jgi:putative ABC transport system permease protein
MNLATLSASYLRARPLHTALSLILLALGVATIVLLVLVVSQLEERMGRDARGIDLVVGAKGSAMQLILSGIYHVDAPTGNIPLAEAQALQKNPLVKKAIPLALGDGWKGYRIVGAGHEYLEHYGARLAAGRLWEKPMEVVLGAEVAARTRTAIGTRFAGSHGVTGQGEEHGAAPYGVVGVLARTGSVLDRLVLTAVESVWQVHEEEHGPMDEQDKKAMEEDREVTVLLLQYASSRAAATLPREINAKTALQAASPANEIARLFRIIGVGVEALRAFAVVLILAAGLSLFVALYTALEQRRYDLAIMRTLGASPQQLFGLLMMEGLVLAAAGATIGVVLGHAFAEALGAWLESQHQYSVTGVAWRPEEPWVVVVALAVGLIAALLPAWRAYRTDVSKTLARG